MKTAERQIPGPVRDIRSPWPGRRNRLALQLGWTARKLGRLGIVLVAVSILTFGMLNGLPGDVAYIVGGVETTPENIARIRQDLGLDHSPVVRYLMWAGDALRGDLGHSYLTGEPVMASIRARLPVTLELLVISQILSLCMAIPAGVVCACRCNSAADRLINGIGFATLSIPSFIMALLAIYLFSIRLHWLPVTGYMPLSAGLWKNLRAFVLPGFSIALIEWVVLMRVLRSDMITTLQQDYILMARAKGLPPWKVILHHAFRPSSFTLLTIIGLQIGRHLGETVIVETLFALPGIGQMLLKAIYNRDYLMVQGGILLITFGYVTINATIDIAYAIIDPRIRWRSANVR